MEQPGTSRQDIKLSLLMSKLIHQIIILDRNEKSCQGVTLSQHYTLDALYRKREMTMKELSRQLNLAISTLTRIVDILVRDGLIERKTSSEDRRKVLVTLTDDGLVKAKQLRECTQQFWNRMVSAIPDVSKTELSKYVRILLQAMNHIEGTCLRPQQIDFASGKPEK